MPKRGPRTFRKTFFFNAEFKTANDPTADADNRIRFLLSVFPQKLKARSLEELEAGMLSIPEQDDAAWGIPFA